ncbi:MAG: O-antigen ligase family protein [Sphingobacteriaceae bacterium]
MEIAEIPIAKTPVSKRSFDWKRILFLEKFNNIWGYCFLMLFSVGFAYIIAISGVAGGILALFAIIAIPIVYAVVAYPKTGITVLLVSAYLVMWFLSMGLTEFPLGTLMDSLEGLLILGFFIKQKKEPDWQIFKDPIGIIILIWVGYNFLEFGNPTTESRMAWVYTIRAIAIFTLMYFIFSYHIRSITFLRFILKLWLALAFFAALYAFKQEHFGFFAFEERNLSDPRLKSLLYINGHWRVFSIFSDPVAFSYNMVAATLICIALIFGPVSKVKKVILGCLAVFFLMTMMYSGTRGAYVLIPGALVLFAILNYSKTVLMFTIFAALVLAFLIFVPSSSPSIRRFQSAFKPSDDASYLLRKANQKRIQPFILSHPMGGGLGATGVWGARFAPNSFLAKFPPDSGYVRTAVELGWIGLFLICTLIFIILKTGINNFYRIKDPELKSYCLAMTLIVFALGVGNYPQEALVQFPSNIYFYLMAAIITVTYRLDKEKQLLQTNQVSVKEKKELYSANR